jgi:hypothetical protein
MPLFTIDYAHRDAAQLSIASQMVQAPTLAEALDKFRTRGVERALDLVPKDVHLGRLAVWNRRGDFDIVDTRHLSGVRDAFASLPIWNPANVTTFFLHAKARADWLIGGALLRQARNHRPIGWTTARHMLHLEEVGAVERTQDLRWESCTYSAHQRLALPKRLEQLQRRDARSDPVPMNRKTFDRTPPWRP